MKKRALRIAARFSPAAVLLTVVTAISALAQQPGDLDPTFGNGGWTGNWLGRATDVAMQPDGKIVVAAASGSGGDFSVFRYNPNGSPDTTFDGDGMVTTQITSFPGASAEAVAIQADGKIIAAGLARTGEFSWRGAIVRYNPDGSVDRTFGSFSGVTLTGTGTLDAMGLQADGKIVISGSGIPRHTMERYNNDGSPDVSFGNKGRFITDWSSPIEEIVFQPDGKIVGANGNSGDNGIVFRLNTNGTLDTTFGNDGVARSAGIPVFTVALQPDGKIVAAGRTGSFPNVVFAVIRYTAVGALDTSFDSDGIVTTPIGGTYAQASAVAVQQDGKIVAAGGTRDGSDNFDFAIARYNTNGSLDPAFGGGDGINTVDFNSRSDDIGYMALDSQGRAVCVGKRIFNSANVAVIARVILGPGAVIPDRAPFDFDGDGKSDIGIFRPNGGEWWIDRSTAGLFATQFGASTDKIVPADFTGDEKTDIAFWQPSTGYWYVLRSEDLSFYSFPFGASGDVPVPADYDGDQKADPAVFRPSDSTWYIQQSTGGVRIEQFGVSTDKPVAADYDGDGKADIAVLRPTGSSGSAEWWIQRSTAGLLAVAFGASTDKAVPGDHTDDGKADIAFWRPASGEWYVLRSEDQSFYSFPFGASSDVPSPADYDGDGKTDAAVYRNGTWFVLKSSGGVDIKQFGVASDKPIPSAYVN